MGGMLPTHVPCACACRLASTARARVVRPRDRMARCGWGSASERCTATNGWNTASRRGWLARSAARVFVAPPVRARRKYSGTHRCWTWSAGGPQRRGPSKKMRVAVQLPL
eukprot:276792-Chlamydomonas_euryale.AAC.7